MKIQKIRYNGRNNLKYVRSINSHQCSNLLFFAWATLFARAKMNATRAPICAVTREKIRDLYGDFYNYFGGFFPTSTISFCANSWDFVGKYYFHSVDGCVFYRNVYGWLSRISRRKSRKSDACK